MRTIRISESQLKNIVKNVISEQSPDESNEYTNNIVGDKKLSAKKYIYFSFNYPYNFIEKAWADNKNLINHLKEKFDSYYKKYGAGSVMNQFYVNLDSENQQILENWIENNYHGK